MLCCHLCCPPGTSAISAFQSPVCVSEYNRKVSAEAACEQRAQRSVAARLQRAPSPLLNPACHLICDSPAIKVSRQGDRAFTLVAPTKSELLTTAIFNRNESPACSPLLGPRSVTCCNKKVESDLQPALNSWSLVTADVFVRVLICAPDIFCPGGGIKAASRGVRLGLICSVAVLLILKIHFHVSVSCWVCDQSR